MPRRKKRRKPGEEIPDSEVLDWMGKGILRVDDKFTIVYKWHFRWNRYHTLKPQIHYKGQRVFYNVKMGVRNRKLFRHRVFWLWKHRELIPNGLTIDHKNHINTDDHPDNLELRPFIDNSRDNWSAKNDIPDHERF